MNIMNNVHSRGASPCFCPQGGKRGLGALLGELALASDGATPPQQPPCPEVFHG